MKIILVIEDLVEEKINAKKAVLAAGYKFVFAANLSDANRIWDKLKGKITGVITDLHFPERENSKEKNLNPCGLAMVVRALLEQLPISICSNIDHHHADYLRQTIKNLEILAGKKIPFTMDQKDWNLALKNLIELI